MIAMADMHYADKQKPSDMYEDLDGSRLMVQMTDMLVLPEIAESFRMGLELCNGTRPLRERRSGQR